MGYTTVTSQIQTPNSSCGIRPIHAVKSKRDFRSSGMLESLGQLHCKRIIKRTKKWSAKYFTHAKSFYPFPTSSMELADVEVMKPPTAAMIDPAIEVAMKELVDKYRHVRQRTVQSETTRDKLGALSPAVYYTQPPHSKVMFHNDSTVEGLN